MTTSLLFAWLTELIGVKQGRVILIQENDVGKQSEHAIYRLIKVGVLQ